MERKLGNLHPCNGGCWFCHDGIEVPEDKAFSCEFDTFFHMSCLMKALEEDPNDGEAKIIAREYDIEYNNI